MVTATTSSSYNVAVGGMTGPGTVIVTVNAGAATGTLNPLPSLASTSVDNTVTFTGTVVAKKGRWQLTTD